MSTASRALVAIACLAGASQIALALYRARVLAEPPWLGIAGAVVLVALLLGRIVADRSRLIHVVLATLGFVLVALGVWATIISVLGGPAVSLIERAAVCATLLSLGALIVVPSSLRSWRVAAMFAFVVGFVTFQIAVTQDARWEADQRTKGILRVWR